MANSNTRRNPPTVPSSSEANSCGAACESDPELRTFDANLQARTNQVLSTLASGVDVRALSQESKEMTVCLLEMNQEVVKVILDSKKDIWRNQELFVLVEDYFNSSSHTLDFCAALENCLKHACNAHLLIFVELHLFKEEDGEGCCSYSKISEELTKFKETGDPFTEEFLEIFQAIHKQQKSILKKLWIKKKKIDWKLKSIQTWRKVSDMILVAAFTAIMICSVMTAAVAAPPVAAALAAATAIPMDAICKWIDSIWKNYENALEGQAGVITSMQASIFVALKGLDKIRITIDSLEVKIKSLLKEAEFPIEEGGEALKLGTADMKKKLKDFIKDVEGLGKHVDMCSRNIQRSRIVALLRIIKPPTNCNGAPIAIENCC
ncbi:UPF0496 protein At4g34320-like [Rhodamnia argentea]|uniref:UPF0496 protein At4g34320-like n=1 Tax=Rhodamnia argentea TaxID=178133 RepID=A0A8B8NRA8_9MYRT|nr:UPF0496 protein At4g34320-like [Rhodamnia argentea]